MALTCGTTIHDIGVVAAFQASKASWKVESIDENDDSGECDPCGEAERESLMNHNDAGRWRRLLSSQSSKILIDVRCQLSD